MFKFQTQLTIRSETRYLALLRQWVAATATVVGPRYFPRAALRAVNLSLIEAVDNAIFHAHRGHREKPIDVGLRVEAGRVMVVVTDRGRGFRQATTDPPELLMTHGRGLLLMRHLMASVEHCRRGKRHMVRMIWKRRVST
ncbi:MAG: ATP-binding protein [Deltaproteobacteria bacterium]|nr:ATP-binding protein [Deltaproteobacteria bacterium]